MTNRNTTARGGPKKPLQIIELTFDGSPQAHQLKPYVIKRGGRRYPLSLYSFNKDPEYEQEVHEQVGRLIEDEYLVSRGSPSWALESSKEITHSGEFPLFIHRLLSPSRKNQNGNQQQIPLERSLLRERRKSAPPKRPRTTYYRANRTHQYLSATEIRDQSAVEFNLLYGRPTRTTLLRARQRCNSASVDSFESRTEIVKRAECLRAKSCYVGTKENSINFYTESGESMHSFLVGTRYNRAHLLDSKSLSEYGVYMPRSNPKGCFMTRRTNARSDETPVAPPETPRSDIDEESTPVSTHRRPASSRSMSGRSTPKSRPRSAWGDNTTTCNIYQKYSKDKENFDITNTDQIQEELTRLSDSVKATRMLQLKEPKSGQNLPSVLGVAVSRAKKSHEEVDELLIANLPPPPTTDTRENTEELQIVGTNSTISQETQHKEKANTVDKSNNAHVQVEDRYAKILPEEKIEVKEIDQVKQDKPLSTDLVTNNNVDTTVKDDAIVNASENIVEKTKETFGKSVKLKASKALTKANNSSNEPEPKADVTEDTTNKSTSVIVSEKPDHPSKGDQEVLLTHVTDVKCDIKIFITEDGEDSKTYEHSST